MDKMCLLDKLKKEIECKQEGVPSYLCGFTTLRKINYKKACFFHIVRKEQAFYNFITFFYSIVFRFSTMPAQK